MSTIFDRARLALAVIIGGGLLLASSFGLPNWTPYVPPPIDPQDAADVKAGVAILERARTPITGAQLCDAIKGLLPNKFALADGNTKMATPTARKVILCFKGGFDYGDAIAAAQTRKLGWRRGLGGEKILVFAPDEAAFTAFARANHMTVGAGDLYPLSEFIGRLGAQSRSHRAGHGWSIDPGPHDEVMFGPYLDIKPGRYVLDLVFEPGPGVSCEALDRGLQASAAVTTDVRTQVLAAEQGLALKPLDKTGCRLGAQLRFTVPAAGGHKLETPIWAAADVPVKLTQYVLTPEG
jgi:hypothetical protein